MTKTAELTVIIPTWNRQKLLEACLRSLERQNTPCQVLVVDNGSTDSTSDMCSSRFSKFGYLRLKTNQGFARAVNAGIRHTDTRFLALLNNDTEAHPDWVGAGLKGFSHYPDYSFFASRMVNHFHRDLLDSAGDCYDQRGLATKRGHGCPVDSFTTPEPVLGASAGAAFYRRDLFEKIGLFDEGYLMYLEDVDLSLRAQFQGHGCMYLPDAIVYHIEAASAAYRVTHDRSADPKPYYSSNRVFWITRNRWQLMLTYQPLRHLPWLFFGWSKSFLFHLLKAGFTVSFLKGLIAGALLSLTALRKRIALKKTRSITHREICRLMPKC